MDFLNNFLEKDLVGNSSLLIVIITTVFTIVICGAYYFEHQKSNKNEKKISVLERAIKDLIEEFRSLELNLSEQKRILQDYKYILEKLDLEISRLADSNKGDSKITEAIQMANQGRSMEEISSSTGLSTEEIEPILKYHGKI